MAWSDNFPLVKVPGAEGITHFFCRSPGGGGDGWCHLVPGKDRALLIDTGFGIGDLKKLVEETTDLPVTVVNTHNHGDHIGGNPQFGEVYIHKEDAPFLDRAMHAPARPIPPVEEREYKYVDEDVVKPAPYKVVEIEDGYVFDLGGGYELEVFHLPGHSAGGIGLLDRKRGFFFSGDALVWTPILIHFPLPPERYNEFMTVERFRDGLLRLEAHKDEIKAVYPGHSHLGLSREIVTDMRLCCDELLAGDLSVQEFLPGMAGPLHIHGLAKIAFTESR
ncbi:MAG: MBL fold metallo-hydrolase, partial [Clostridia bacterium]|nr:MBL fold metallo-hydrolase [Clostridia bacterium]